MANACVATAVSLDVIEERALAAHQRHRGLVVALRWLIFFAVAGAWEAAASLRWIDPFFFGRPSGAGRRIYEWVTAGTAQGPLWAQMVVTLEEAVLGFLIGSAAGVSCGIALGRNRLLADVSSVYIKIANSIPRIVLGSIFIVSLGAGLTSKVALAAVMVFFIVSANVCRGVREAGRAMIINAQILGASPWQLTTTVVIPSAMSWMFASLRVSVGFAIVGAIVGEFLGSKQGIGLLASTELGAYHANGVFAAMLILTAMVLIVEYVITAIEDRFVRWRPAALQETGMQRRADA